MDNISGAIETAKKELPYIGCRLNESMVYHTSLRIGGCLRAMFFPANKEELMKLCDLLHKYEISPLIIGNGTNLLTDDSGPLEIVAIKTTGINHIDRTDEAEITAGAGIALSELAAFARDCGLSGLECMHGIPGSLGGAVAMNAGAYGREMRDIVRSTTVYNHEAGVFTITAGEHEFSYRRSRFADTGDIILSSVIALQKGDKRSIGAKMDELSVRRRESQPYGLPSAGSAFKRPENGYAAALIEQAGLKGFSIGGAQVSVKHAGFIINKGGASFSDVIGVIEHVQEAVFRQTGIKLEPEIKIIRGGTIWKSQ